MSKNNRTKSADEGGIRVSIPAHVRPTIQSIRETTGKQHSDDEIYAVLQDCSMDPDDTVQKLLYLDTFHEVKKKRDRKKEQVQGLQQGQGARAGRGNYYPNYSSSVAGGGRNAAPRRENGVNHITERGPVLRKTKQNTVPQWIKASTAVPNGSSLQSNGSLSHGHDPQSFVDGVIPESKDNAAVDAKRSGTAGLLPTPTFASVTRGEQEKSTSRSSHLPTSASRASVSDVYSSASDPVLPPPRSRHPGAANTIVREVGSQKKDTESSHIQGDKNISHGVDMEPLKREETASITSNSVKQKKAESKSNAVEKNQLSESFHSSSLSAHDSSLAIHSSNSGSQLHQESDAPLKGVAASITVEADSQLLPEPVVSDSQHVTFPNHFKVPEAVKTGLTFGSIDAGFGLATKYVNDTNGEINSVHAIKSSHGSDATAEEPSLSSLNVSSTAERETPDHLQSPPLVDEVAPSMDNISTGTDLKPDELVQEIPLLSEDHQKPTVQSIPNYGFGFMLPSPGNQLVQVEGSETQAHDASHVPNFVNGTSLAPTSSSPAPSVQSSVAPSQPPVQLLRHPYPNSFFPYGHYLSPYYMSPMPHQFLGPNGLPQQPSTGNVYLSPAAAAPGVKYPLSQFKPGTNAGNPAHIGLAPGYGSYSSSHVGFNPVTAGTSGKSNEDISASQLKDNQIYTTGPSNEGSGVWMPAPPGQDLSNMQISSLYNLAALQGQHMLASHGAFPGIYPPAQTVAPAAPSNVNPLMQQSQAMGAAAETMGTPSGAYQQQPQLAQLNWNPSY